MSSRLKGGKAFITLDDGDVPLAPKVIPEAASALACLTEGARLLVGPQDARVPLFDTTALHASAAVEAALAD